MSKIKDGWLIEGDEWWPTETPFGEMLLAGSDEALHHVRLPGTLEGLSPDLQAKGRPGAVAKAAEQIDAYFAGALFEFDLPLAPIGTPWQEKVWWALGDIAYGKTSSYMELAEKVGNVKACRAVGLANGRNPLPLVLPCHRVIGSNGSLTGYGGGIELKQHLLEHEQAVLERRGGAVRT
ncbi:MAG: methylated-DNA--[protein]-cysteine S-methyltransferase [Acidimicrobiales bacterium]